MLTYLKELAEDAWLDFQQDARDVWENICELFREEEL